MQTQPFMQSHFRNLSSLIDLSKGPILIYLLKPKNEICRTIKKNPWSTNNHFVLQQILKSVFKLSPQQSNLRYTNAGKPFLLIENFQLSIAHTQDAILYGFSTGSIGVDIEKPLTDLSVEFIHQVAGTAERKYLFSGNTPARLLKLWTIKEAWFKAQGSGLPSNLYQHELLDEEGNWLMKNKGWTSISFKCPGTETASMVAKQNGQIQCIELIEQKEAALAID